MKKVNLKLVIQGSVNELQKKTKRENTISDQNKTTQAIHTIVLDITYPT